MLLASHPCAVHNTPIVGNSLISWTLGLGDIRPLSGTEQCVHAHMWLTVPAWDPVSCYNKGVKPLPRC